MLLFFVLVSVVSGSPLTSPSPNRPTEVLLDSPASVPDPDNDHNFSTTLPILSGHHNPPLPATSFDITSNPSEFVPSLIPTHSDYSPGAMRDPDVLSGLTLQRERNEGRSLVDSHVSNQALESLESSKRLSPIYKATTPSPLEGNVPSSSPVKVTHQVSHIVFEVSEVGPVGSTIPAPTTALKPTLPMPISLLNGRNVPTRTTRAPVFVPKISVDGQPLPPQSKRYHSERMDSSLIPTEPPLLNVQGEPGASLKVVSHYASTAIDSAQKPNATNFTTTEGETMSDHIVERASSTPAANAEINLEDRATVPDESKRKENLKELLSESSQYPKISPALDLVGDERDIESLISPAHLNSAKTNVKPPVAKTAIDAPTVTSVADGKIDDERQETTPSTGGIAAETTISANIFDPGEAAVSYGAEHLLVTTVLPGKSIGDLDDLSDHEKTFKREAVGKKVNALKNKDISSLYEDYEKEDGDIFPEDLPNRDPRIYLNYDKELEDIEKKKQEQQLRELKAQKERADADVNSTETPKVMMEMTKILTKEPPSNTSTSTEKSIPPPDTKPEFPLVDSKKNLPRPIIGAETPESDDILDETSESNVDLPPFIDDDDVTRDQLSSLSGSESHIASVINLRPPVTNSSRDDRLPIVEEDLVPEEGQEGNDSFSGRSLQNFAPTAAAVAEAAVLNDLSGDVPHESRSLDSSLTANKRVLEASASPALVGPKLARGVSAAPASPGGSIGTLSAIVCGSLVAALLIIGILLFVLYQRRAFNGPKALGSDRGYAGSDSGGYLDDQCQSSYTNSHMDIPKGCPDDLISLDNDSFLNSLESMTIQNLWTDNIRHTKL